MRIFVLFLLFSINSLMALPSMSYEDILEIAKPQKVLLSPSGSQLSYVTRKGDLKENRNIDSLFLGQISDRDFKKVFVSEEIIQAIWNNGSTKLYTLSKEKNLYRIRFHTPEESRLLIEEDDPIKLFALSSDESDLYYTISKKTSDEVVKKWNEEGYVYNWGIDSARTIQVSNYQRPEREEIWSRNLQTLARRLITSIPAGSWHYHEYPLIDRMQVSDDGSYLLLFVSRVGDPQKGEAGFSGDSAVWNLIQGDWKIPISNDAYGKYFPTWISDHQYVYHVFSEESSSGGLRVFDLSTFRETPLKCLPGDRFFQNFIWDKKNHLLYGMTSSSLYRINLSEDRVEKVELPDANLENASFDQEFKCLAFVTESSNVPPEISCHDFQSKQTQRLTTLNPQLALISRGHVEVINEKTADGHPIEGYLVHPVNEKPGIRYPVIIASYGFSGCYIADAEWHSSFPAQSLAAEGYLVFLLNTWGSGQICTGGYQKAQELEGWNKLSIVEGAIDFLAQKGGDLNKVGIYGWSNGGFVVNFMLTHSNKIHAACLGEGCDYGIANFWHFGEQTWQGIYDNTFGGPPWGNLKKLSSFFSIF